MLSAIQTWRFDFKFVLTIVLTAAALYQFHRSLQPGHRRGASGLPLGATPLLLLAGVLIELSLLPQSSWAMTAIGTNAILCLTIVPALGALALLVLKR